MVLRERLAAVCKACVASTGTIGAVGIRVEPLAVSMVSLATRASASNLLPTNAKLAASSGALALAVAMSFFVLRQACA